MALRSQMVELDKSAEATETKSVTKGSAEREGSPRSRGAPAWHWTRLRREGGDEAGMIGGDDDDDGGEEAFMNQRST